MVTTHFPNSPPRLELTSVSRFWGERCALEQLSLTVEPGECTALIGPSGGGKSTLLKILAGVLRPTSGELRINGSSVSGWNASTINAYRRRCGFVDQGARLVWQTSVHQNVLGGMLGQWPWWKALTSLIRMTYRDQVHDLLAQVGIAERQFECVANLSGGQQQRVAIARGLIARPSILFADEPTAALDPATAAEIASVLIHQARQSHATLFFCTHWFSLVRPLVDRVIGLREGKLFFSKPTEEVSEADLNALYEGSHERH